MSEYFDFVHPILEYVRRKAKEFLEINGVGDSFTKIENAAKTDLKNRGVEEYINTLLNNTVSEVFKIKNKDWNTVRDEFNSFYLN